MALKQTLQQKMLQKLSPQQIQLMKMLQLPTQALEARIKEEIESNPALEEGRESEEDNISWQALSAMIVLCRAKETKEGLLASMEMLKELGYEDVCGPIFERTNMKILKTAALSAAAAKRETR